MKKNTFTKIEKKTLSIVYTLLQSFLLLQVLIFTTELFYPARIRRTEEFYLADLSKFHNGMMKIFAAYSVLLFTSYIYLHIKKEKKTKNIVLVLSIFTALFSNFSIKGHTYYFYTGRPDSLINHILSSLILITIYSLLFYLIHVYRDRERLKPKMTKIIERIFYTIFGACYLGISAGGIVGLVGIHEFFFKREKYNFYHSGSEIYRDFALLAFWVFLTTYIVAKYNREKKSRSKYLYFLIPLLVSITVISYNMIT